MKNNEEVVDFETVMSIKVNKQRVYIGHCSKCAEKMWIPVKFTDENCDKYLCVNCGGKDLGHYATGEEVQLIKLDPKSFIKGWDSAHEVASEIINIAKNIIMREKDE